MRAIFTNPTKGHLLLNDKYGNLIVKLPPNQTFDLTPYIGEVNSLNEILELVVLNNHIESLVKNKIRGKSYNSLAHSDYFVLYTNSISSIYNLKILFADISLIAGDPTSLDYWNTLFDTSNTADKSFDNVNIVGNLVKLSGPTYLSIKAEIFLNDTNLISIIDDPIIKEIRDNAFNGCVSLAKVSLSSVTSIADYAFANCTSLNEISLPVATTIGKGAFAKCTSLSGISLPAATAIGEGVFDGIVGKTITLTIPHDILSSNNSSLNFLTGHNTVTIIEV